jgi:hypothetical protein
MFHGLPGAPISVPDSLYPTPLSQYDPSPTSPAKSELPTNDETSAKSGGGKKYKKKKAKKGTESTAKLSQEKDDRNDESDPSKSREAVSFRPNWAKISSSESEYSDTEGGQSSQQRSLHAKVRQCALACLHTTIKVMDLNSSEPRLEVQVSLLVPYWCNRRGL